MINTSQAEALETQIKDAEDLVQRRNWAIKLSKNYEFRKLFLEDYFVKEAARLIGSAGDPRLDQDKRNDALEMAKATGHTKRYLEMIAQMGAHYERVLPEMREELELIRAEDIEAAKAENEADD